jgi:UDP-glucose 4-epimerase
MILVTGAAGYIGSHICYKLKNKSFIAIDNLQSGNIKNIKKNWIFYKCNINSKKVKNLLKEKIKTVIHCAADTFPHLSEEKKKKYFQNNILNSKIFINNCKKYNIEKFIFTSTSNVYSDTKSKSSETKKNVPENYYGETKLIIENYLKNKFKSWAILRIFNVAGYIKSYKFYESKSSIKRIIPQIIKSLRNNTILKVYCYKLKNETLYTERDFIHINDIVKVIFKILKKFSKKKFTQTLNVGSGNKYSIIEIINKFEILSKKKIKKKIYLMRKGELKFTHANNQKLKKILNVKMSNNLNNIILSSINRLKSR